MRAVRLLLLLVIYYAALGASALLLLTANPGLKDRLPIGSAKHLIAQPAGTEVGANTISEVARGSFDQVATIGESILWMLSAVIAAFLAALPVSWVYVRTRSAEEYDQSLISTILILPMVVTSIVIIVQNSLSLAFALAGIAGAVRFKNSLKSSGDALYILLSVGIGLAAGTGAAELAYVMSLAFTISFVILWLTEYGERTGMKRYMSDFDCGDPDVGPVAPTTTATVPPLIPPATDSKPG
jgi:ABC-type sugar transport system permease subunit